MAIVLPLRVEDGARSGVVALLLVGSKRAGDVARVVVAEGAQASGPDDRAWDNFGIGIVFRLVDLDAVARAFEEPGYPSFWPPPR